MLEACGYTSCLACSKVWCYINVVSLTITHSLFKLLSLLTFLVMFDHCLIYLFFKKIIIYFIIFLALEKIKM
jgi:hypothetical protein